MIITAQDVEIKEWQDGRTNTTSRSGRAARGESTVMMIMMHWRTAKQNAEKDHSSRASVRTSTTLISMTRLAIEAFGSEWLLVLFSNVLLQLMS